MPFLPVITRELRSSSRHAFTYYLRAIGVGAMLLASVLFALDHGFQPNIGGKLFGSMHFALFCSIWVLVPLLTADCISRERREGTLGLLFLTRLSGPDIVIAKGLAQGLRAVSLWIAVLPVVAIPFLLGGLSLQEIGLSLLLNVSAMCWALSAGLLASVWSKSWTQAVLRAAFVAFLFLICLGVISGVAVNSSMAIRRLPGVPGAALGGRGFSFWPSDTNWNFDYLIAMGLGFLSNVAGRWQLILRIVTVKQLAIAAGEIAFSSFLMLAVSIYAAGGRISRIWREEPPSARTQWLQKTFTTPIFWVSFFKGWMLRKLERNPIGWLEQRTWTGRVITWGWFAVIISIYSAVLTDKNFFVGYHGIQAAVGWLLCGSLAVSAAGSFRRERESGMLELLLVSPVGEGEIVFGRLRGLWGQFFPAFATLLVIWYYFATLFSGGNEGFIPFYALCFLTLPVIGLYYSLRCRQFMTAFLSTLAVGLVLPMIVPGLMRLVWWFYVGSANNGPLFEYSSYVSCLQLGLAAVCWHRLYHRLINRSFPLHRGEQ